MNSYSGKETEMQDRTGKLNPDPKQRIDRREALLNKVERITEIPLLVLSFAMVPLLAASLFWDLAPNEERTVFVFDAVVWALFAIDLVAKTAIAPDRKSYLLNHWLEVLIVVVPIARPFRLIRIVVYGSRAFRGVFRIVNVDFLLGYAVGLVLIAATVVTTAERGSDSPLGAFPNSLWWAVSTVTTVGYGDMVPVTPIGRAAGVVLMLGGIGLFGAVTANVTTLLVRRDQNSQALNNLAREIESLKRELARPAP